MKHGSDAEKEALTPSVLDAIDKLAGSLRESIKRTRAGGVDALSRIDAMREALDALTAFEEARHRIQEELQSLERAATLEFMSLGSSLLELCSKHSWQIHGGWPSYIVERGIAVDVNESKRTAIVGGRRVPATVLAVERALEPLVADLVPRGFDAGAFVAELAAAYDEVCRRNDNPEMRVLELYRAFVMRTQTARFWKDATADRFIPLGHDQFRARLSLAMELVRGGLPDGRRIHVLPPLDPADGVFMFLPGEARFAHVGRIVFASESPA